MDSGQLEGLVRTEVAAMQAYTPIVPFEVLSARLGMPAEDIVKLDANENPYGPSPRVREALASLDGAHIYPDPEARGVRVTLSEYLGIDAAHILVGAGADELIDLLMRLFLSPGDAIVNCPPTFGMYGFDAALNAARVVSVPRRDDFSLDVGGIERAARESGAKLAFVCSPNNPDGGVVARETLERLLELPLVVVVDEAYVEFSEAERFAGRVAETDNLVVLRTFSKWAGLAGLRVGYGVFPLWMMAHLWKIKQPYNLNVAADAAVRASLADLDWLMANVEKIRVERGRLVAGLAASQLLEPVEGEGNFVLCRVEGMAARALKEGLEGQGVLIRYYDSPGLRDCVRVGVGRPKDTDAVLAALARVEKEVG